MGHHFECCVVTGVSVGTSWFWKWIKIFLIMYVYAYVVLLFQFKNDELAGLVTGSAGNWPGPGGRAPCAVFYNPREVKNFTLNSLSWVIMVKKFWLVKRLEKSRVWLLESIFLQRKTPLVLQILEYWRSWVEWISIHNTSQFTQNSHIIYVVRTSPIEWHRITTTFTTHSNNIHSIPTHDSWHQHKWMNQTYHYYLLEHQ